MNYFKKILTYALPYKFYGFLNIFFNILYALFSALSFIALIPMLDVLFPDPNAEKVISEPTYQGITNIMEYYKDFMAFKVNEFSGDDPSKGLMIVIALVISMFLLKNLSNYTAMFFMTYLRNGVLKDLRDALYKKVIELPLSYFSEKRKGDVMARIGTDVLEIQISFLSVLELIFREPLTIIFTILAMLAISVKLTIFVFIFIPISGLIISLIGKKLKKQSDSVQKEQGIFLSILDETLSGLRVIKGFNAEPYFEEKFEGSTNRFYKFLVSLINRKNLASPTSEFLGIVVIAILLWYGGNMILIEGTLDRADFIPYMGLAYNILTPAKAISKASYSVKKGDAAAERVLELLEMESPLKDKTNALEKTDFNSSITIEDITFSYDKTEKPVLENFTLEIPKGKTIALVGQSGSGKSTIANLLTRFYDVEEGAVKIDGIDIKDIKKKSLRGLIGLVTQKSILFNDTIANNIKLGNQNATHEEIIEATKIANAYEFIKEKGFDTNIGDEGGKLSGGQQQRIAIARAVLKDSPIMILDEATSALDTESEKVVQVALENMTKNRTTIVIAHRLSTIKNADLIVVMQKGKIVEKGNHSELINKDGVYKKLVEMQSFA